MKLLTSEICDCDSGSHLNSHTHAISGSHIIPVNGCQLPMKRSPLQAGESSSNTPMQNETDLSEDSDDVWPDL